MDVRKVRPSEWQCQEAASVADELPAARSGNNVGFTVHVVPGETRAPRLRWVCDGFAKGQCSFSYVNS